MKKKSLGIIALAILSSLLVSVKIVPVKAAPSSSKTTKASSDKKIGDTKLFEDTPLFESRKFHIAFVTSLSMTALAILVGTGRSIKYNRSQQTAIAADEPENSAPEPQETSTSKAKEPIGPVSQLEKLDFDRTNYRKIYQDLQQQVYQSPDFANNPSWEADSWEVDVEIAIIILERWPEDLERVKLVLSESDRVREWQKNLPQAEYPSKSAEYIQKAYNWAGDLQQWRNQKINAPQLSSQKSLYN